MRAIEHHIGGTSLGTQRHVTSLHFGKPEDSVGKAYIQAGLHASELPGLLVAYHLRELLQHEEQLGRVRGEIVLVPVANPIGLDQTLLSYQMGRFDLASGENFNRYFPLLTKQVAERVKQHLCSQGAENVRMVRAALREEIANLPELRPVDSMRKTLMSLSCDADVVIDLHCDCESVLHLYADPATADDAMRLSALMGAVVTLCAEIQGNGPFDEITGRFWRELQHECQNWPLPIPTVIACVELRGQLDVSHELAREDAQNILSYLRLKGLLDGGSDLVAPQASHKPTPLNAVEVLQATSAGVIVYVAECGERLRAGDPVVEVVDPVSGLTSRYCASEPGVLFARQNRRYATPGMDLGYIAGETPRRQGLLLSA